MPSRYTLIPHSRAEPRDSVLGTYHAHTQSCSRGKEGLPLSSCIQVGGSLEEEEVHAQPALEKTLEQLNPGQNKHQPVLKAPPHLLEGLEGPHLLANLTEHLTKTYSKPVARCVSREMGAGAR